MKTRLLICVFLFSASLASGQRKPRPVWSFYGAGLGYMDGTMQFFEGYDYTILYANAKSGLPVYSDWDEYSPLSTFPKYYQGAGWIQFADTNKRLRLRFTGTYYNRFDSLVYSSALGSGDVIFGRTGSELTNYFGLGAGLCKTTKRIFRSFYLFGGVDAELGFAGRTKIRFYEYTIDIHTGEVLEEAAFRSTGKFRVAPFVSANVGMEIRPIRWIGLVLEAKSGLGLQWVINERAFGLSRTALCASIGLYPGYFPKKKTEKAKS